MISFWLIGLHGCSDYTVQSMRKFPSIDRRVLLHCKDSEIDNQEMSKKRNFFSSSIPCNSSRHAGTKPARVK